jgi:hypothetical protein
MVEAAVLDSLDRYLLVEDLLEIGSHVWDKPEGAPFKVSDLDDAETAAESVRKAWNLGGDAIPNVTELLEEHGIKVLKLDFPLSVDGLTCRVARTGQEKVPVIRGFGCVEIGGTPTLTPWPTSSAIWSMAITVTWTRERRASASPVPC